MNRSSAIVLLLLVGATLPVFAAERGRPTAPSTPPSQDKPAWEWTNDERREATLDPVRAAARAADELRARGARRKSTSAVDRVPVADVIDGKRDPELLFPNELFRSLLRHAYTSPHGADYRRWHLQTAIKAGLPSDFWERVAVLSVPAFEAVRPQRSASATDCSAVADAYNELRRQLGPGLDQFLYLSVAPTVKLTLVEPQTERDVRMRAGECK